MELGVAGWRSNPDYTAQAQSGTSYPLNIDAAIKAGKRLATWFAPHQQDVGSPSPDMTLRIDGGWIDNGVTQTEVAAQTVSGFTIPSAGQNRVDRVVIDRITGVATRVAGTAVTGSPSSVAPAIAVGKMPCCQVYFTSADTAVLNTMIADERMFASFSDQEATAWTPTDASGAALSLTVVADGCIAYKNGQMVHAFVDIIYPATADGTTAKIGGLPWTAKNTTNNIGSGIFGVQNFAAGGTGTVHKNTTTAGFELTGTLRTNAQMSTNTVRGCFIYPAAV